METVPLPNFKIVECPKDSLFAYFFLPFIGMTPLNLHLVTLDFLLMILALCYKTNTFNGKINKESDTIKNWMIANKLIEIQHHFSKF